MPLKQLLCALALGAMACGGATPREAGPSSPDGGVPPADVPDGADGPASQESGVVADGDEPDEGDAPDGGTKETATHGCTDERYVDRRAGPEGDRVIRVTRGNRYDPPCMAIQAGQAVTFTGNLAAHPLAPGVAPRRTGTATAPSPIEMRSEGTEYRVRFPAPGDYPYYCVYHAGGGMYGVVRVAP